MKAWHSYPLNWRPSLKGHIKDHYLAGHHDLLVEIMPKSVDLRHLCPPVVDQGQLGSCSINTIVSGVLDFIQLKDLRAKIKAPEVFDMTKFEPGCRLLPYYGERDLEGNVATDAGATSMVDGFKALALWGNVPETMWPYDITKFAVKPPPEVYAAAALHKVITPPIALHTDYDRKHCLASGYPFGFGTAVFSGIMNVGADGMLQMPDPNEYPEGGHAITCVGFNDMICVNGEVGAWLIRNSWGTDFAMAGYFWMPYSYMAAYADEFLTIR